MTSKNTKILREAQHNKKAQEKIIKDKSIPSRPIKTKYSPAEKLLQTSVESFGDYDNMNLE